MALSKKVLHDAIRTQWKEKVLEWLKMDDEEGVVFGSNKIAVPVVDNEGNKAWVTFTVAVPTGTHDGWQFNGYEVAEDWEFWRECRKREIANHAKKEKRIAAEKARRIADRAKRIAIEAERAAIEAEQALAQYEN